MLTLLLAAALAGPPTSHVAILAGIEGSRGYGERSPGYVGEAVAWGSSFEAGLRASTMDKYTGAGWYLRGWADGCLGHGCLGLAVSHRDGGPWSKRVVWLRGGWRSGPWRMTAEYSWSPDTIMRVWVSGLDVRTPYALRLEGGPSIYHQPGRPWNVGWHARVLVGVGR